MVSFCPSRWMKATTAAAVVLVVLVVVVLVMRTAHQRRCHCAVCRTLSSAFTVIVTRSSSFWTCRVKCCAKSSTQVRTATVSRPRRASLKTATRKWKHCWCCLAAMATSISASETQLSARATPPRTPRRPTRAIAPTWSYGNWTTEYIPNMQLHNVVSCGFVSYLVARIPSLLPMLLFFDVSSRFMLPNLCHVVRTEWINRMPLLCWLDVFTFICFICTFSFFLNTYIRGNNLTIFLWKFFQLFIKFYLCIF